MNSNVEVKMPKNPVISQAFADARESLAAANESHTGSWWNASVLRKREILINALSDAVQSGAKHADLFEVLDGTGGYDTEEERADNEERDAHAISSIQPLIEVLAGAGMTISGAEMNETSQEEDVVEV